MTQPSDLVQLSLLGVVGSTHEVKRYILLLPDHLAVVWGRRDMEEAPGCQLDDLPVIEGRRRDA